MVHSGSAVFAALCLAAAMTAQSADVDQFKQMRTNLGEQMQQRNPDFLRRSNALQPPSQEWIAHLNYLTIIPPLPPGLGDDLPYASYTGASLLPASGLTREIFYGTYATLSRRKELSAELTQQVAQYRQERDMLVREIDAKLDALHNAPANARADALAELARRQENQLQRLAGMAERIRSDLAGVKAGYDFLTRPAGAAVSNDQYDKATQESLWLLEAVYKYPGLSIEQRQLLPEIAYDTQVRSEDATDHAADEDGSLYFLPATARIELPTAVSPALEARIEAFAREKQALKDELRHALQQEFHRFSHGRAQRLAALADAQAPRFAALERLAEEIRVGLADDMDTAFAATSDGTHASPYRNYVRAVLEPGLSPAQRRLLFQAATEDLDRSGWLPRRA